MKVKYKTILLMSILFGLGIACGKKQIQSKTDAVIKTYDKWPEPNKIPVCFIDPDSRPVLVNKIKEVVPEAFGETRTVNFRFMPKPCSQYSASQTMVRLAWRSVSGQIAGWSRIGKPKQIGAPTRLNLPCDKCTMVINVVGSLDRIMRWVVHEFGHAAGLYHEHDDFVSKNDPDYKTSRCKRGDGAFSDPDRTVITPYDKYSTMNYCRGGTSTRLSTRDIVGLHELYPPKPYKIIVNNLCNVPLFAAVFYKKDGATKYTETGFKKYAPGRTKIVETYGQTFGIFAHRGGAKVFQGTKTLKGGKVTYRNQKIRYIEKKQRKNRSSKTVTFGCIR